MIFSAGPAFCVFMKKGEVKAKLYKQIKHNVVVLPAKKCSTQLESFPQDFTDTLVVFATKSFTAEADLQANISI